MSAEELLSLLAIAASPTALALLPLWLYPKADTLFAYIHRRKYEREHKRLIKKGYRV